MSNILNSLNSNKNNPIPAFKIFNDKKPKNLGPVSGPEKFPVYSERQALEDLKIFRESTQRDIYARQQTEKKGKKFASITIISGFIIALFPFLKK